MPPSAPISPSFPHDHPALKGAAQPEGAPWTAEELANLDWYRLAELLRAMAANAGCQLGPSRVSPDCCVQFAMVANSRSHLPERSLVRLSPWNQWDATPQGVDVFAWEVRRIREETRGVLVAPGGATPAAMTRASELGVEIVDAAKLCRALQSLSPEQSLFFHSLTFSGDFVTPTCPICLNKLTRVHQSSPTGPLHRPTELVYQATTIVPEAVDCERLEVMQGCEVTFLHEVRARREVVVRGHVSGDFTCLGTFSLESGASFNGTVAARGVDIKDGAEFQGISRILESVTDPVNVVQPAWFWRCQHPASTPECRQVTLNPHAL